MMSKSRPSGLEVGLAFVTLCAGFVPGGLSAQASGSVAAELESLYQADQADRTFAAPPSPEEWAVIVQRDAERRARVLELVRADSLAGGADYYHAAMVLQHGEGTEDILLAHILATAAAFLGDDRGRWLSAAALDRYLHRSEQPQRLGTQYLRSNPDEPWTQDPYEDWLPDSVRAVFRVESREAQLTRASEMNGGGGGGLSRTPLLAAGLRPTYLRWAPLAPSLHPRNANAQARPDARGPTHPEPYARG